MDFDVAVVGLGGMGSAILAHSARRGASAIGLEQFSLGHELGSSSGRSRIIRKAYFEDPAYVPLLLRSYELWRELEYRTSRDLLRITGLLMVGGESAEIIAGARRSAGEHSLPMELLSARQLRTRYPALLVHDDEVGVFEPDGGVLNPEASSQAHLEVAEAAGAQVRFETALQKWEAIKGGYRLHLANAPALSCRSLVLSLGPWFQQTLESLGVPIRVQRNVQAWFSSTTGSFTPERLPPFLLDRKDLPAPLYGLPDFGDGVKAAFHCHGETTEIDQLRREIDFTQDVAPIMRAMQTWAPGAAAHFSSAKPCPYTLTSDGHFVIDRHPKYDRLILCGGFSGHGFKFAPVVGEICADLALEQATRHDIEFLSLRRFAVS